MIDMSPSRRTLAAAIVGVAMLLVPFAARVTSQTEFPALVVQVAHLGRVHSMNVSIDGRLLATAGQDRTVKVWDVARGLLIRSFEGHGGEVRSANFNADASRLVSASDDGTVRVWDVASGRLLKTLTGERGSRMTGAAFVDADTILASQREGERTGDGLNELALWNAATGRKIRGVRTNGCGQLFFTADRSLAFSEHGELWDVANLKRIDSGEIAGLIGGMHQAAFSANGNLLAMVTSYGLDVWDVKRLTRVHAIRDLYVNGHDLLHLTSVAFAPDGRTVAAADEGGRVGLWDALTGQSVGVISQAQIRHEITALAFTPDGRRLLSATEGEPRVTTTVWRVDAGSVSEPRDFSAPSGTSGAPIAVTSVRFSPDGRLLAAGGADAGIRLWSLQSGQLTRLLTGQPHAIRDMAFSPDGKMLVSSSQGTGYGRGLLLWDTRSNEPQRRFESVIVDHVAFHPDGRTVIAGDSIQTWDTSSDEVRRRYRWACDFVAMSPDGKTLACNLYSRPDETRARLMLVDAASGNELRTLGGHNAQITSAAFSPDGARLVTASNDRTLAVWDVRGGGRLATLSGHTAPVLSVAYNQSGSLIASGSADNTIRLWDTNGRLVRTLTGHSNAVRSVAFGPEGMTLASGSDDGTLRIWSPNGTSPLATVLAFGNEDWLAYGSQGHFNASTNRSPYVTWRVGNTVYEFDQFFERFYTPDLLVRVFQGASPLPPEAPAGGSPPPDVVIVSPRPGQSFRDPDIEIALEVKDMGGGVGDVRLALNGKRIDPNVATREIRPSTPGSSLMKFRVSLLDGTNTLRATAFSSDRTESIPHEMTVRLDAPVKEAALRLLAVGISRYQNPGLALTFPSADARGVAEFFRQTGSRLFRAIDVIELSDENATESAILQALVALQRRSQPQDVVVVFLAGHGASLGSGWYFIPQDLRNPEREEELLAHGISSVRLAEELRRVSSQKVLLLVDACYSGSMLSAFRGYEDRKALAMLARSAGVHILAAATRDQRASEVPALGHGIFSYALLRGLGGGAALRDVDQQVTVQSLVAYIRNQLPDLGRQYQAEVQDPVSFSNGMDFPLAITR